MTSESITGSTEPVEDVITVPQEDPDLIIGGMRRLIWSGEPMWECPRCKSTTFQKEMAAIHTCPVIKYKGDNR